MRRRRRVAAAGAAALMLSLVAVAVVGQSGEASTTPRIDGRFGEWHGRTVAAATANGAGLVAFGFQPLRASQEVYLEFAAPPFGARADVWLFLDEDGSASTGYFDGAVGAESAVRLSGEGGRIVTASAYSFAGGDRFDLNRMATSGGVQAAVEGARLEFSVARLPAAFAVTLTTASTAVSSGALGLEGEPLAFAAPGPALSMAVRNGIRIDGDFSDWASIEKVKDPADAGLPARLDMLGSAAVGNDATAEFYLDTRGNVLAGTIPLRAEPLARGGTSTAPPALPARVTGTDLLLIYLDTDLSSATGAPVGPIGAEYLLRVEGVDGVVVATEFFAWGPSGWAAVSALSEAAASGHELEVAVDASELVGARARFEITGFEGVGDANDQPVVVGRQAGAFASDGSGVSAPASVRGDIPRNPIPELSDFAAAAGAAAVLALFVGRRRRTARCEAVALD